jgi:hypothetical protein
MLRGIAMATTSPKNMYPKPETTGGRCNSVHFDRALANASRFTVVQGHLSYSCLCILLQHFAYRTSFLHTELLKEREPNGSPHAWPFTGGEQMRNHLAILFSRGVTPLLLIVILVITPVNICAQGDVVDRVVAVVGTQIITLSDIRIEKTMREVLGEPLPKNDREVLDELIHQRLIRAQLEQYPLAGPTEAEVDEEFSQVKEFKGLPAETVREAIREHLRLQRFFSERFGRFLSATDDEIEEYYDQLFVPAARARGLTVVPPLADVREDIRKNVVEEKTAAEVRRWLDHTKRTAKIQILDFN